MTIARNRFFNNPQFAQAAANLSALFAPPSGADAAGWATAEAKRAEAEAKRADAARLQQYHEYMTGADYDEALADRMGIGVGRYNPNQSFRAVDTQAATQRYGYDTQAQSARDVAGINNAGALQRQFAEPVILNEGQRAFLPRQTAEATELMEILEGTPKPLTETQWQAGQNQRLLDQGTLTDNDLMDAIMGERSPVEAIGPDGRPTFMSPGAAVRQGAQPYDAPSAERIDNYLAVGPNGEEMRFPGYVGSNGQIINSNTNQAVPNVIRKEGTGGGMSFEVDGQGGVRFTTGGAGNTVSQQTNLQGQRDAAAQSARELQTLFDNITASDVGVAGNFNDFLTNYGAQVWPDVARGDVTAMRSQMQATTMRLARSLAADGRISDTDRRMAQEVMAGQGLGESLPGARAKIAALTVLHAYRAKFAGSLAAGGEPLPPINGSVLGQLVDDGAISPAIAAEYQQTMLSGSRGGPTQIPSPAPQAAPTAPISGDAPAGIDPAEWQYLTPEEKALFQ